MDENKNVEGTPVIHTLESDTFNMMENTSVSQDTSADKAKKIRILIAFGLAILFSLLSVYLYFAFIKNKKPAQEAIIPVREYKLVDVLPEFNSKLSSYTDLATSTEDSMIIDLLNFDNVYAFILQNEKWFGDVVGRRFELGNVSEFADIKIQNNDLRIADGESGPIVYGYVDQKKLIIAKSIELWLKIRSSI